MFIKEALSTIGYNDQEMYNFCKVQLGYNTDKTRLRCTFQNHALNKQLGPTIIATLLALPDIKFRIYSYAVGRNTLSNANLATLDLQTYQKDDPQEQTQLKNILRVITNYSMYYHTETDKNFCSICVINAPSGHSNLKKVLAKANYTPLAIEDLAGYASHKVDVYRISNTVLIITNDLASVRYSNLIGWLPILFKTEYANLKTLPELYDFYKTAYTRKIVNLDIIKNLSYFKDMHQNVRNSIIETFIKNLEKSLTLNLDTQINECVVSIRELENKLTQFYTHLNTAKRLKSTGNELENKDLITMCLKNNPNIINIKNVSGSSLFNLIMFGPVDYDRKAMATVLKTRNQFIKWLFTTTEYTLCWESICTINLAENSITAVRDQYSENKHIRNTHWHRFQCFGNNYAPIIKALINHDYLSALSQIITAAQLLNAYDITVLNALIEDLTISRNTYKAFINNETKQMYSTNELVDIFRNKENEVKNNAK